MAKQTFTTGQVLTAAQMTSLQQTAMGGGSATAKTASYTLVAADAGATVIMNSASATTITVNTSLFSAGDTVFIQNIGAGVSTITAGTATVNTASSLALSQYDSGVLYFTAAGASIFSKAAGVAAASGSFTKISTTSISGSSGSISNCFSATYDNYKIVLSEWTSASNEDTAIYLRTGSTNTTSGYDNQMIFFNGNTLSSANITIALFEPYVVTGERIGGSIDIQSPFLTKNTSAQCFQSASNLARLSLSYIANTTSYESLGWAIPSGGSGVITIYGLEK